MRRATIACLFAILAGASRLAAADQAPDVAFLTAEQARAAIVDESVEPYFSLLQTREMSAKTGSPIDGATLDAQRDACRKRYQAAVGEFSHAEQQSLTHVIASVQPFLLAHYPVFAAEPWRFIKIGTGFEGGMPHTRGHCIVLSEMVTPMFTIGEERGGVNPGGIMLLVHEQTHVVQRLHPELFAPLYTEGWGLTRMAKAPEATGAVLANQLVNPDGIACVWAFPMSEGGKSVLIQPQVLLGGTAAVPRMPADFDVVALTVEKTGETFGYTKDADGKPRSRPLAAVEPYVDTFAPSEENFHPNEICAELLSRMVTLDLIKRAGQETACQQALRAWADCTLAKAAAKAR